MDRIIENSGYSKNLTWTIIGNLHLIITILSTTLTVLKHL